MKTREITLLCAAMVVGMAPITAPATVAAATLQAPVMLAQAAGINRETGLPGSAGPKDDGVVQRGGQPNAGEVRPGNADGNSPSASAGTLRPEQARRIFGLPVTAALLIGAVIVAILAFGGIRRARARGNGTYGRAKTLLVIAAVLLLTAGPAFAQAGGGAAGGSGSGGTTSAVGTSKAGAPRSIGSPVGTPGADVPAANTSPCLGAKCSCVGVNCAKVDGSAINAPTPPAPVPSSPTTPGTMR